MLGRYEWIIVELLVLGVLVYELVSISRSLRKDKEAEAAARTKEREDTDPPSI